MTKFIPNTPTVNPDKEYFVSDSSFYKRDSNIARGINEAFIMGLFHSQYIPIVKNFAIRDNYTELELDKIDGDTLENWKKYLSLEEKEIISNQLIDIFRHLQDKKVVHGDINESNVLYDRERKRLYLIDFEFAQIEVSNRDLTGPHWGIIHALKWLHA